MKFNTLPGHFKQYNSSVQHAFTFDFDFTREHVLSDAKKNIYLFKKLLLFVFEKATFTFGFMVLDFFFALNYLIVFVHGASKNEKKCDLKEK